MATPDIIGLAAEVKRRVSDGEPFDAILASVPRELQTQLLVELTISGVNIGTLSMASSFEQGGLINKPAQPVVAELAPHELAQLAEAAYDVYLDSDFNVPKALAKIPLHARESVCAVILKKYSIDFTSAAKKTPQTDWQKRFALKTAPAPVSVSAPAAPAATAVTVVADDSEQPVVRRIRRREAVDAS